VLIAFIDKPSHGVIALIFFLVYQGFETNVLQVAIMSRTVKLSPLAVLISMLLGIELLGILGAFVAIPVAGVVQAIARDLWTHRHIPTQAQASPAVSESGV